jgi:hypothetical protein
MNAVDNRTLTTGSREYQRAQASLFQGLDDGSKQFVADYEAGQWAARRGHRFNVSMSTAWLKGYRDYKNDRAEHAKKAFEDLEREMKSYANV